MIDWYSQDSHVFVNDRSSPSLLPSDWEHYREYPAHIWLATSGTSSQGGSSIKWVALSKNAFLASALSVNQHLGGGAADIWLNPLPLFHVGGLSIFARSGLSGAKVEPLNLPKWDPEGFVKRVFETKATLASLVPAQVFDLVKLGTSSPPALRAVLVGGGALTEGLYEAALKLGWKVLPTYGMTECSSQVATAFHGSPDLHILPHVQCHVSSEGLLQIKSESLLTGYLEISPEQFAWRDPKLNGVLTTEDKCAIEGNILSFSGRIHDWIKIGGENVSLFHLEQHFEKLKPQGCDAVLLASKDERLGAVIVAAVAKKDAEIIPSIVERFNQTVMPYEKIRKVHFVDEIPRNALGKVVKKRLSFC
jgi:o-succinylbenzoate---CoA ligase